MRSLHQQSNPADLSYLTPLSKTHPLAHSRTNPNHPHHLPLITINKVLCELGAHHPAIRVHDKHNVLPSRQAAFDRLLERLDVWLKALGRLCGAAKVFVPDDSVTLDAQELACGFERRGAVPGAADDDEDALSGQIVFVNRRKYKWSDFAVNSTLTVAFRIEV
jgi:hypothetical protein